MVLLVKKLAIFLQKLPELTDPRVESFTLAQSLWQPLITMALYILLIFKIGPMFMANRKPFDLKPLMIIYNILQVLLNTHIFLQGLILIPNMSIFCSSSLKQPEYNGIPLDITLHYQYTLLKIFDIMDSVFIILRGRQRQLSFLHIFHHIGILMCAWIAFIFFPGGQCMYVLIPNTLIHAIMYSYYLLTSWSSNYSKIVWIKKFITQLQILQHVAIFMALMPGVFSSQCAIPSILMAAFELHILVMILLFSEFYIRTYHH